MKKKDFEELKDSFLLEEKLNEKAEKTLIHYEHIIDIFLSSLNEENEIAKKDIILFKNELMKQYKPSTISNYITVINKFIKYAEIIKKFGEFDLGEFKDHKSKMTIKNIKVQQKTSLEEVLEPNEFKRMLRIAKQNNEMDMYYIMKILAYTGIRIGELKFFTVENIQKNYIEVRNKGKIRTIILRNDLKNELIEYCKKNNIKEGLIFRGRKEGHMLHQSTIWKRLRKIASKCRGIKLEKVHAHSFRHLFAVEFIEEGNDIGELADILGHASVDTTRIYARKTKYMQRKKLEKMKY